MTRQEHIIKFCEMLKALWLAHPDLRFGQLIDNVLPNDGPDLLFYFDDDKLVNFLKETYGNNKKES